MEKKSKERIEQRKATNLVRSIMILYLEKSGKYSKEEIERRVNENIKRVNLRPRDNDYLGDASIDEPEITIYGVDSMAPTVDEIIFNLAYYKSTILHEGEHKFFTHKDEEGNIIGTGLLRLIPRDKDFKQWLKRNIGHADMKQIESFVPNAQELKKRKINLAVLESEIGRGINEGFTEWYRVKVLGCKGDVSYENITSVLDKLQEYVDSNGNDGISEIAEYGDSDYDYVFDTLNMSKPTGIAFVRILDVMYYLLEKKKVDRMDDIIRYFELEEANVLQPDFISRYGERIRGLDIFGRLQDEYKKLPYRKESFKEFVSRKNEEKNRALLRYQRLISDFLSKALEKREKVQEPLELPDISRIIEEVTVLSAQNMDDIAEGMRVSFERHKEEVKEKTRKGKNKEKTKSDRQNISPVNVEKSKLEEEIDQEQDEGEIVPKVASDLDKNEYKEEASETGIDLESGGAIDSITSFAKDVIDEAGFEIKSTIEGIKLDVKDVLEDLKYNIDDMVDDIKFELKYRKIVRPIVKGPKVYSDRSGKLAFIALAAALGISSVALTAYLFGQTLKNLEASKVQITEPQGNGNAEERPELPIEIPEASTQEQKTDIETEGPAESPFPLLNEDGTISLKAGATIYRSSDKVGGKTTLKYDYDSLIIDYIKLMQNNNQVLGTGDLSRLKEFMESLGEEDLSLMMRLAVEQNGEKVYIAWCDYAEMIENAKSIEDIKNIESTER